jgi:transposase
LADWRQKAEQIHGVERELASLLAQTPWILLLSHPGINVVSAAELAGETGPIEHYASPKAITGRAGLFPSRYQSDKVDRGGNLSRFRNGKMRSAWLLVADNTSSGRARDTTLEICAAVSPIESREPFIRWSRERNSSNTRVDSIADTFFRNSSTSIANIKRQWTSCSQI